MLENGYLFLKYILSQGLGELAAGNDSGNKPQSDALLRTTLRYPAFFAQRTFEHNVTISSAWKFVSLTFPFRKAGNAFCSVVRLVTSAILTRAKLI